MASSTSSSRSSSSSFHSLARYSISSIRTEGSSSPNDLHQHFLDSEFGDGVAVPAFNTHLPKKCDPKPYLNSPGGHGGDSETFGSGYGDERESYGGYQGDRKSWTGGYQGDRSHGNSVQASSGRPASMGLIRATGDIYFLSADVSQFEPHDVVVMAYNHNVVIHAEKVGDDGSVRDKFTHKSLLPEDMDPLSVSGTLTPEGMLVVSVRRSSKSTSNFHKGPLGTQM